MNAGIVGVLVSVLVAEGAGVLVRVGSGVWVAVEVGVAVAVNVGVDGVNRVDNALIAVRSISGMLVAGTLTTIVTGSPQAEINVIKSMVVIKKCHFTFIKRLLGQVYTCLWDHVGNLARYMAQLPEIHPLLQVRRLPAAVQMVVNTVEVIPIGWVNFDFNDVHIIGPNNSDFIQD